MSIFLGQILGGTHIHTHNNNVWGCVATDQSEFL